MHGLAARSSTMNMSPRQPKFSYAAQVSAPFKRWLIRVVEMVSGCLHLQRLYLENRRAPKPSETFWSACIRHLQLDVRFDATALAKAPKTGPLIVVSNHPYGVLDGLVISHLAQQVRADCMILASAVLMEAPEVLPYLLPIDLSNRPESRRFNATTRRRALLHLRNGGALIVFPAGLISTSPDRWGRETAVDPVWKPFTAHLVRRARASVLPVFFHGQNGRLFQIVSYFSRALRLALIFHEVKARIGTPVHVAIGETLCYPDMALFGDDAALIRRLREITYALGAKPLVGD